MATPQQSRVTAHCRGVSLIELLVGMAIGVITLLIVAQVFTGSESRKRTTTGASDAQQAGSFSAYALERQLRLAGSGLAHVTNIWGCQLNVWRSNATMVPLPNDLSPASPSYVTYIRNRINTGLNAQVLRLTPVLIVNGGGNVDANSQDPTPDTLLVMAGQHESATVAYQSTGVPTATTAGLVNTVSINQNDLLIARDQDPAGATDCRVVQAVDAVSPATSVGVVPNPLNFAGGIYTPNNGTAQGLNGYSATVQLGNLGAAPSFMAYSLGTDGVTPDSLLSYDLIQGALGSVADNIVNLQAVYGVAANSTDPSVATWQAPTGTWSAEILMNGTVASANNIARIRAVRVVVVSRSAHFEKAADWTAPTLSLLQGLTPVPAPAANVDMSFAGAAQRFRYRTYDVTIPLRNMLLMNNS